MTEADDEDEAYEVAGAQQRVVFDRDLRVYAAEARRNLARLPAQERAALEPALVGHERALRRYDELAGRGRARQAALAPLVATGAFVLGNDATGVGLVDDVTLPFIALGLVAVVLATSAPASEGELGRARAAVVSSAQAVGRAMAKARLAGQSLSAPGTRQVCIDLYVDCQLNSRRGFPRRQCQACMDLCLGGGNIWPDSVECRFR
ncbi:MAG: hypothetical protein AAGC55_09710 [Myxococcota bacterium]